MASDHVFQADDVAVNDGTTREPVFALTQQGADALNSPDLDNDGK